MDSDLDQHLPAAVVQDVRQLGGAGGTGDLELRVVAAIPARQVRTAAGDDQVYAAAELVRRGVATRVVLVNAPIDLALPADWEIRGTPVHLERRGDGRTVLTAGPVPQR